MFQQKEFQTIEEANLFAEERAAELSIQKNGAKITPLVLLESREPLNIAIGYLTNPTRDSKLQAISLLLEKGKIEAGKYLLGYCLWREESDPRIGSNDPQYDDINIGAIISTNKILNASMDQFQETKKK